jgi:ethanolamine utilization protein EutN
MIKGRVIGKIWSSRRVDSLPTGALLEVETEGGGHLIAFDPLGCNIGEAVLITQGSVAAAYFTGKTAPVDALIIGSIDEETPKSKSRK